MWDDARDMVPLMSQGEFWYLYNVRAKWGKGGCIEGKMHTVEKTNQLDEENADKFPHLKALLQ